jgi:hypothetical protein
MKKFFIWLGAIGLAFIYVYKMFKYTRVNVIDVNKNKIKENNKKINKIRSKKVNEKHFHDMSNKSLIALRDRLRKKRRDKSK